MVSPYCGQCDVAVTLTFLVNVMRIDVEQVGTQRVKQPVHGEFAWDVSIDFTSHYVSCTYRQDDVNDDNDKQLVKVI